MADKAFYQGFVRNLQGESRCFSFRKSAVAAEELARLVEDSEGIPSGLTRLVTGTQTLQEDSVLLADDDGFFPSCTLVARLLGGKGGFGSLLRGSQSQKKTTNFDACRDMNGRRLRHVNSEKKLVEWQEQAKDREMEKLALEQVKKDEREAKQRVEKDNALAQLRVQTETILDKVVDAVKDATSVKAAGKRKVEETAPVVQVKRVRTFGILEEDDDDSEDEGPDDGLKTTTIDTTSSEEAPQDGAGPSGGNDEGTAEGGVPAEDRTAQIVNEQSDGREHGSDSGPSAGVPETAAGAMEKGGATEYARPLDFSQFGSAQEMEVLGLERLKEELQERGLKCGGSLGERAARLFLLKSTPLEKLDKKLFAKPPVGKKGLKG